MKKVAVFGNAGGGKSTLARRLSELMRLPLYSLDLIKYKTGGGEVPHDEYLKTHDELIHRGEWIIDGFGCVASAWERFSVADTLIYLDLSLYSLRVGDQAAHQRPRRESSGLAEEQSNVEQYNRWLSCNPPLPPSPDSQVPAACC